MCKSDAVEWAQGHFSQAVHVCVGKFTVVQKPYLNWLKNLNRCLTGMSSTLTRTVHRALVGLEAKTWVESLQYSTDQHYNKSLNEGPDFQKILSQTYDKILVKVT